MIKPHEWIFARKVFDSFFNCLDWCGVIRFKSEPQHVQSSVHLELVILWIELSDKWVCLLTYECFKVVWLLDDWRATFNYLKFACGQTSWFSDVVECHVCLLCARKLFDCFSKFANLNEIGFVSGHLTKFFNFTDQRFIFFKHRFYNSSFGSSTVVVRYTRSVFIIEYLQSWEARDTLLSWQFLISIEGRIDCCKSDVVVLKYSGCLFELRCQSFTVTAPWCLKFN